MSIKRYGKFSRFKGTPGYKSLIQLSNVGYKSGIPSPALHNISLTFGQYCLSFQTGQCSDCILGIKSTTGLKISIKPNKSSTKSTPHNIFCHSSISPLLAFQMLSNNSKNSFRFSTTADKTSLQTFVLRMKQVLANILRSSAKRCD